jgi:hypothetical protein
MSETQIHAPDCKCPWCEQARLHDYYYYRNRNQHTGLKVFAAIAAIIITFVVLLGTAESLFDPNVNFPVISQVVCSVKGGTWYDGGLLGSPGCYRPQ